MKAKHTIGATAKRTGLPPYLIRVWERRYGAVIPLRTDSNRRLYTDEDIERLILLKRATEAGESIGQISALSIDELHELVPSNTADIRLYDRKVIADRIPQPPGGFLESCLMAIEELDAESLEATLMQASVELTQPALLDEVVGPLMYEVGDLWHEGKLKVVHEHLASAVIRTFLGKLAVSYRLSESSPKLVVATPIGQLHEFGALMVNVTAVSEGWQTVYLGPNLPAAEIALAVRQNRAAAVALSIVYPSDDPLVASELAELRRLIGDDTAIIVGGRAASGYSRVIESTNAMTVDDLSELKTGLESIRLRVSR